MSKDTGSPRLDDRKQDMGLFVTWNVTKLPYKDGILRVALDLPIASRLSPAATTHAMQPGRFFRRLR